LESLLSIQQGGKKSTELLWRRLAGISQDKDWFNDDFPGKKAIPCMPAEFRSNQGKIPD